MSKICAAADFCQFKPNQTSGGCPAADYCPCYCEYTKLIFSTSAEPYSGKSNTWSTTGSEYTP